MTGPPADAPSRRDLAASATTGFKTVEREVLADLYRRQPTLATYLGIHDYDQALEDYSADAVQDELRAARRFQATP